MKISTALQISGALVSGAVAFGALGRTGYLNDTAGETKLRKFLAAGVRAAIPGRKCPPRGLILRFHPIIITKRIS
jgi:hypothetical protein